jgi:deoxyribodipyrimidine photo-lyase
MVKHAKVSLFIFHRSLRLDDNKGLMEALRLSDKVIPIFIFTPEQITKKNKFRSLFSIMFMVRALQDLDNVLKKHGSKLYLFYGPQHKILKQILADNPSIDHVYVNIDCTLYAISREQKLSQVCRDYGCEFTSVEDYALHSINSITNTLHGYYSVFTPFYRNAITQNVNKPKNNPYNNYINPRNGLKDNMSFGEIMKIIKDSFSHKDYQEWDHKVFETYDFIPSRREALIRLKEIKNHEEYGDERDNLFQNTTRLSPYIKFGLVSIREVYHRIYGLFGIDHDLIRQLYWREFYYNITYNRLDIFEGNSFKQVFDTIEWDDNNEFFNKWKNGKTGCPVVDAGILELNQTGYMHNRTRLITSNYLVKHLFVDWRQGERYYASKLMDYDPSVNNGNWQFSSSSGADSQPYFRILNPWTQGKKHDPDCLYIKKWIPELRDVLPGHIHEWYDYHDADQYKNIKYPAPCKKYDFKKLKKESKKIYGSVYR